MEDLLDAREVARTLGVSVRRLEQLAKRSEFPELLRIGRGQYRLRRTDYEAWYRAAWTKEREARADLLAEQIRHELLRRLPPTRVRQ
jgi:predicted DNA-binding transcriptional regulator AlpA